MELTTIWTLPAATLREKLSRTREWAARKVAHRLPRRLAYWSYIDTGVRHIRTGEVVPDVTYMAILDRIGKEPEKDPSVPLPDRSLRRGYRPFRAVPDA